MKNRLIALNLALLALIALLAWRYRVTWLDARERERRVLAQQVLPAKAAPLQPVPPYAPLIAASYIDVAQKMLFAKDRNPNIVYAPPAPAAPPPPMPALPGFYGLMTGFGDPGIILSDKPGGAQKIYRAGDTVGPFKLVSFDTVNVVFDWNGQRVEKRLEDLLSKAPPPIQTVAANTAQSAPSTAPTVTNSSPLGPGVDLGNGTFGCQANDSTPAGTVQNGLRKVETANPFGKSCVWQPVK